MNALRHAAVFALGIAAVAALAFALILARLAKKGDRRLDDGLGTGTEHENGVRPKWRPR